MTVKKKERRSLPTPMKLLREKRGFFQEDVAKALEMGRAHLSNIEQGKTYPGRMIVDRLSRFYGISGKRIVELCKDSFEIRVLEDRRQVMEERRGEKR